MRIDELRGLWKRSLLARPGEPDDVTTLVDWLQGPSLFADLRSPSDRPDFSNVRRLRDLDRARIDWLATQEGFAGCLVAVGDAVEWRRVIDYQPPSEQADAGRLSMEGDVLVEVGRDAPYLEHWRRDAARALSPCFALRLVAVDDGRAGFVVRVGPDFMFARDRLNPVAPGPSLEAHVAEAPDLVVAQDLVDCEISLGVLDGSDWRIVRSTLPFREGEPFELQLSEDGSTAETAERAPDGAGIRRRWSLVAKENWP